MTYSLLLHSLLPRPTRQELENLSSKLPFLGKADCAYIVKDWNGIVTSGLSVPDAFSFQAALREIAIETDLVADLEVPPLVRDFRCQRIDLCPTAERNDIILTTALNRRTIHSADTLLFLAAGFLEKEKMVTDYEWDTEVRNTGEGSYTVQVQKKIRSFQAKPHFRIDLFFMDAPERVSLELDQENVVFHGDQVVRLKNRAALTSLMLDLQTLIIPELTNRGLREFSQESLYPSMHAYEEEIRWAMHRGGVKF